MLTALMLVLLAGLSLLPALAIQRDLSRARASFESGRNAFLGGDLGRAQQEFDAAASAFIQARSRVNTPFLSLAAALPVVGRTPDSIEAMAAAGANVSGAAGQLTGAISRLPGGLAGLAPADGAFSLEALVELQPVLRDVASLVGQAVAFLDATERTWLLPQVARARAEFEPPLVQLAAALRSAADVTLRLPDFLGAQGVKRYFVAAQNPAEIRGTGGFIGSYAILSAFKGAVRFSSFEPIETLPDAVGKIAAPNPDYAERYGEFGGAGFWRNINMTRDFPSAAVAIERLYRHVRGVRLDGVIAADPQSLAALLAATGPIRVPSLGATLDAGNVVDYTTNRAYSRIPGVQQRRRVLGDAAKATFDRFVEGPRRPEVGVRELARTVAEGHLLFHAVDEPTQAAFDLANASGRLEAPPGSFVAVSASNAAANKLDYYVRRSLRYDVRLNADGSAAATLNVSFENPSPTAGQPRYVIGPFPGASEVGESVSFLSTYCGSPCELERHTIDGAAEPVGIERELGHRVFSEFVHVPAGSSRTLGYELALDNAWLGDSLAGSYALTIQDQPSLVNPTPVTITVHAPPGARISATSLPMSIDGGRATWTGPGGKMLRLRVEFQKPLPARAWSRFVRFLTKPLF